MKLSKLLLATSSALVLSVTGALADNNRAYLDQDGTEHSALITQSGDNNDAGATSHVLTQLGHRNDLTILQLGNGNAVGLGTNSVTGAQGIVQSHSGSVPSNTRRGNTLSITQSSNNNVVGSVNQSSSTQGNNTRNTATIIQAGEGGNQIDSVRQRKNSSTRNILTATQEGSNNLIATISQNSNVGGSGRNSINVFMAGTDNGRGALGGFAATSGATTSSLVQDGRGNAMDLVINGRPGVAVPDANQFGITQLGYDNTVNTITLDSKRTNLGIYQSGNNNEVAMSRIEGNDNTIGIRQLMSDNIAEVNITGNGVGNAFFIDQDGNANNATVTISGSNNGDGLVFGDPLTGAALTASLGDAGWERGVVRQIGNINLASLAQVGNGNMFGTLQRGAGNQITSTQNGSINQLAVVQVGMNNVSNTTQIGNGNNVGITQ